MEFPTSDQTQTQSLIFAVPQHKREVTDISISIVQPLKFPYNLFLNSTQLLDTDQNLVYFFIYTIGSKKISLWGTYNKETQEFSIDGGCRYDVNNLMTMYKTWKSQNFIYVSNTVKNRPKKIIGKYLNKEGMSYSDYKRYKYILSFIDNKITEDELEQYYPDAYVNFVNEFERLNDITTLNDEYDFVLSEYIAKISDIVRDYEKDINLLDTTRTLPSSLQNIIGDNIVKISNRFKKKMETGYFQSANFYDNLEKCPNISQCHKNFYENGCEVYYYGDSEGEYLNPDDPQYIL